MEKKVRDRSENRENIKTKGVNALLVPTFCTFSILVPIFYFYHF